MEAKWHITKEFDIIQTIDHHIDISVCLPVGTEPNKDQYISKAYAYSYSNHTTHVHFHKPYLAIGRNVSIIENENIPRFGRFHEVKYIWTYWMFNKLQCVCQHQ